MLMCRHVVPHMIAGGGGAVVNVSSVVALRGNHPAHIYSAAKGGLISFTRSLAGSYSDQGVRANVICPGLILTERVRARYRQPNEERPREGSSPPSRAIRSASASRRTSPISRSSSRRTSRAW